MSKGPDRDVTRADVLDLLESRTNCREPWTSTEVAEELDASRRPVFNRLRELVELDEVATKQVGANARIWWIPADDE